MTATSGCKVWAVGSYMKRGRSHTLIEHWNGRAWKVQKSPNPGRHGNGLNGVFAASPTNIWAVGYYDTSRRRWTLILHWNGKTWKVEKSPTPGTRVRDYSTQVQGLYGVAATSPTNAWAVGVAKYRRVGDRPLIEHWNGKAWKVQKSPSFPEGGDIGGLEGVDATSATNAWAVGFNRATDGLIEHWNGKAWKAQRDIGGAYSDVYGVALSSPANVRAVGTYYYDYCGSSSGCVSYSNGLIGRWRRKAWKVQRSPNPGHFNELRGVTQTSGTNAWAVGYYCPGTDKGCSTTYKPLIEHWNGKAWKAQKSPNPGGSTDNVYLYGVAATSRTNAWAVGNYRPHLGLSRTLALHWNGTAWKG